MSEITRRIGRPTAKVAAELKERVLDETFKTLCVNGSERLSMDQLAQLAGVTKRTIYRQFGSKAGLVNAVVNRQLKYINKSDADEISLQNCPVEALKAFAQRLFSFTSNGDVINFANYIAFEAAADPEIGSKQLGWHNRILEYCDVLIIAAQKSGAIGLAPARSVTLLLMDLLCGSNTRLRSKFEPIDAYGGTHADGFFHSRWIAFMVLATEGPWSEFECSRKSPLST